jgi:hypothetical protein
MEGLRRIWERNITGLAGLWAGQLNPKLDKTMQNCWPLIHDIH